MAVPVVINGEHIANLFSGQFFFEDHENRVYGMLYNLKGNTASSWQFYATDSANHFLRGALYFSVNPNKDSLSPAIDFFGKDVIHIMETLKWNQ